MLENKRYQIINALLYEYTNEKDSVYLHPKVIEKEGQLIQGFMESYNLKNNYFDQCNDSLKSIVLNDEAFVHYKKAENISEEWEYSKIVNPKVFTQLELKIPESIDRYKRTSEMINDKYNLLARQYMLWSVEHSASMLMVSQPFVSEKNRNYSICFLSEINEGDFVWIFQKKQKQWEVICKLRLNYH